MKKVTMIAFAWVLGLWSVNAQTSCTDLNGYVDAKNTGGTGNYTLITGFEESAAQTYNYSGPGRLMGARIYGNYPGIFAGVPLRVNVYSVGVDNRPTATVLYSANATWWNFNNGLGYIDVVFGISGIPVNSNFAIGVDVRSGVFPFGSSFAVQYTGNGEGKGEDLASIAGTSTGSNWVSAKTNFNKDGDFYLVPRMRNFITSDFSASATCIAAGSQVSFTNLSSMSKDSMFNTIGLSAYTGSEEFYAWDFGDGSAIDNSANPSHTFTNAGVYTVSLTNTLDGWNNLCSNVKTMKISVGLAVAISGIADVNCNGSANGSVTAIGSGGYTPYKYSLNNDSYFSSGTFTNLSPGNYTMYVRDFLGCKNTVSFTIKEPAPIVIASLQTTNASCSNSDGAFLISATGGVATLTYSLNNGPFQASGLFSNRPAGIDTLTIKDGNGCTKDTIVSINSISAPALSILSYNNVSCYNGNDGAITVTSTGGTGTPQFSINGGSFQATGVFSNLAANDYIIVVKDAAGCIDSKHLTINESPELALTASTLPVSCFGGNDGEINVTSGIGGIGTLSYSINGTNYQSGTNFAGISAGNYTVYVKDVAGCTATTAVTVDEPQQLAIATSVTDVTCNGDASGTLTVIATGGIGSYNYSIGESDFQPTGEFSNLTASVYTITVSDANNCIATTTAQITQAAVIAATINTTGSTCGNINGGILVIGAGGSGSGYTYSLDGTTFQGSGLFSPLVDSVYYPVVKDGAGCTKVFTATVTDADGPVIQTASHTDVTCYGSATGSITITSVTGGTGTIQYGIDGSPFQLSNIFTGLVAGAHTVVVKDANGCSGDTTITLTQPNAFTIIPSVSNVSCFGGNDGSVSVAAAGGSGTLTYALNAGVFQSSSTFSGLTATTYIVTVKDASGCTASSTFAVNQANEIGLFIGMSNVSCQGANDGVIFINAVGGTGTFQYSLDGTTYQSGNVFIGLNGGSKTVYVKDANNCVKTSVVVINEPSSLVLGVVANDVSCAGGNDGSITLNVTGGVAPYNYNWSTGVDANSISVLVAGSYSVVVTDENGCSLSTSATITEPANPIVVNGTVVNASGSTAADGSVNVTTTGGTGSYTYSWSNGATSEDISNVVAGTYNVDVTDANGCIANSSFTVNFTIGIANVDKNNLFSVIPNPAKDYITIESGSVIDRVVITDVLGQVMISQDPKLVKMQIDLGAFEQGVYLVQVTSGTNVITKRIIVNK